MKDKVILGTANFGLEYGIANQKKLGRDEIFKILELAQAQGVWGLDTASVYGDAEEVIGEFFARHGKVFRIIGKLPRKEYLTPESVENEIFGSMKRMNISFIDSFLMHSFETYAAHGKAVIPVLERLCRDGVVGSYGISVYHPEEAYLIDQEAAGSLSIEFPASLFDQRFLAAGVLQRLKEKGHTLFARSIFLQGLLFLDVPGLKGTLRKAGRQIEQMRYISKEHSVTLQCMALLFVISKTLIDGVVIGVDGAGHLMSNFECLSEDSFKSYINAEPFLAGLAVDDEDIILPYRWKP